MCPRDEGSPLQWDLHLPSMQLRNWLFMVTRLPMCAAMYKILINVGPAKLVVVLWSPAWGHWREVDDQVGRGYDTRSWELGWSGWFAGSGQSQLLHIQSSSLLKHLKMQQKMIQVFGPWKSGRRPRWGSWLLPGTALAVMAIWAVYQCVENLSLSPPLFPSPSSLSSITLPF